MSSTFVITPPRHIEAIVFQPVVRAPMFGMDGDVFNVAFFVLDISVAQLGSRLLVWHSCHSPCAECE
uniref:Uncharacterized protein n=1 Tax=Setaria italica TaxID=4555 RepID=K4AHQ3_SETIT